MLFRNLSFLFVGAVLFVGCVKDEIAKDELATNIKQSHNKNQPESKTKTKETSTKNEKTNLTTKDSKIDSNATKTQEINLESKQNLYKNLPKKETLLDSKEFKNQEYIKDLTFENEIKYPLATIQIDTLFKQNTFKDALSNLESKKETKNDLTIIYIYTDSGELRAELSFKNNVLHGVSKAYKNNEVIKEVPYINGKVNGVVFEINGKERIESNYENGLKNGNTRIYKNNQIKVDKNYKDGILHGEFITYDDFGDLETKSFYHNGLKNGESIGYLHNKLAFKQHYKNGLLHGDFVIYGENNNPKIERNYNFGLLDDVEKIYENNKIYYATYVNGAMVMPYKQNDDEVYFLNPLDSKSKLTLESNNNVKTFSNLDSNLVVETLNNEIKIDFNNTQTLIKNNEITNIKTFKDNHLKSLEILKKGSIELFIYNNKNELETHSLDLANKQNLKRFINNKLDNEITWVGEITEQKGFYSNGAIYYRHKYDGDEMIEGAIYDKNGSLIYGFKTKQEDIILDSIFTNTALLKRRKTNPSYYTR